MNAKLKWAATHPFEMISMAGFSLMLIMVSVNVGARYLFNRSFSFTEELAYLGFTYSVFFGLCILYRKRAMIAIDIVVDNLPPAWQRLVNTCVYALLTVGNGIMAYYSGKLTIEGWARPTASLRIPYSFVDFAAFAAFVMLTIYSVQFTVEAYKGQNQSSASLENRA